MGDLRIEDFGNNASELGAFDKGADPGSLNEGHIPHGVTSPIEVDVEMVEGGIALVPQQVVHGEFSLREGPMALAMAQMCDDSEVTSLVPVKVNGFEVRASESRLAEVSSRGPREMLVWYGAHPDYFMGMTGDRILVMKDALELEDACKKCHGKGFKEGEDCPNCGGAQMERNADGSASECRVCKVLGYDKEQGWSCGKVRCEECRGTGWRGGIIIPQVAERKPITGVVVSVGPECRLLKLGDRVGGQVCRF